MYIQHYSSFQISKLLKLRRELKLLVYVRMHALEHARTYTQTRTYTRMSTVLKYNMQRKAAAVDTL